MPYKDIEKRRETRRKYRAKLATNPEYVEKERLRKKEVDKKRSLTYKERRKELNRLQEERIRAEAIGAAPTSLQVYRYKRICKKYGLTLEEYRALYEACQGKCLICQEQPEKLCVDHDHVTGKVRGMLCKECNSGLGFFKDKQASLLQAISYLDKALQT